MFSKVFVMLLSTIFIQCNGYPYGQQAGEAWRAYQKGATWGNISQAYTDASAASSRAAALYPTSLTNGMGDAFRHCYWNCLMTVHFGVSQAKIIADNHEAYNYGPDTCYSATNMDMSNNLTG
eukprot:814716_1